MNQTQVLQNKSTKTYECKIHEIQCHSPLTTQLYSIYCFVFVIQYFNNNNDNIWTLHKQKNLLSGRTDFLLCVLNPVCYYWSGHQVLLDSFI